MLSIIDAPDWVNVIARTPEGSYVLVRQVRHGLRREMVETPGGTVDLGEDPLETARRELCEETGYVSEQWRTLGLIHPNPAIQNNRCHIFLAEACVKAQDLEQDEGEDIQVELWSKDRVMQALRSCEISCALVMASFFLLVDLEGQSRANANRNVAFESENN